MAETYEDQEPGAGGALVNRPDKGICDAAHAAGFHVLKNNKKSGEKSLRGWHGVWGEENLTSYARIQLAFFMEITFLEQPGESDDLVTSAVSTEGGRDYAGDQKNGARLCIAVSQDRAHFTRAELGLSTASIHGR